MPCFPQTTPIASPGGCKGPIKRGEPTVPAAQAAALGSNENRRPERPEAAAKMSGATIQVVQALRPDSGSIHRVAETFVKAKTSAGIATPSPVAGQSI
jgi:hypothetical protein